MKGLILTAITNYFDLHCDTVTVSYEKGESVYDGQMQLNIKKGNTFKEWKQCFSLWLDDKLRGQPAFSYCNKLYDHYLYEIGSAYSEMQKNLKPILTIENASALGENINNITYWKNRGVKMMSLTWNGDNSLGSGVKGNHKRGLTAFGKQCVKEMEKQEMIIDVSHLNEKGFWDVCECATKPFVCSHSNCCEVFSHPRNLKRRQVEMIRDTGGLIGLCFVEEFLTDEKYGILEAVYRNVCYLLNMGCEKNIALGSDFDGADMTGEIKSIEEIEKLYEYLLNRGINEKTVNDIFYNNAEVFFGKQ